MRAYIDIRGVWPVYIFGFIAVEMTGCYRSLTVAQAETILRLGSQPF